MIAGCDLTRLRGDTEPACKKTTDITMALYYIGAFMAVRALPSAFDRARSAEKDFDLLRHTGGSDGPRVLFVGNLLFHGECTPGPVQRPARRVAPPVS